jgi:predicted AAA+ superfamily ATPase
MNEETILEVLLDWNLWGNLKEELTERPLYLEMIDPLLARKTSTVLYGIRRSGKSSIIYLYINRLIKEKKITANDSLFINFEDPRLRNAAVDDCFKILEIYRKNLKSNDPIIILDEIQNIDNWEKFVRYLVEAKKLRVFVTGSSSKLLSLEISTSMSGRHVDVAIFPLNFREFLHFKGMEIIHTLELMKNKADTLGLLDEYMTFGGFPEVVSSTAIQRKNELLGRYYEDIMVKDIARRYKIREIEKLENLAFQLLSNISTLQSFNKLKEKISLSLDSVERFSKYFEIAGLFIFLKKFAPSTAKQLKSVRKTYIADLGFYHNKGFRLTPNKGSIYENIVAIELDRRAHHKNMELYYWQNPKQYEVDFVVKQGLEIKQLIQVCCDLSDENTKNREMRALLHAGKELGCKNLLIICEDREWEEEIEWFGIRNKIKFQALWKWLL